LQLVGIEDKRLIDIGCCDRTFTVELFDRGRRTSITAIDPSADAIGAAEEKRASALSNSLLRVPISCLGRIILSMWLTSAACCITWNGRSMLKETFPLAPLVVSIEPNGYNQLLKVLERASRYDREHEEKS